MKPFELTSGSLELRLEKIDVKFAALCHFFFAILLFSPFFLFGKNLIGSTDNYFHIFANQIFSHHALHQGTLGLWNPYIMGGIDFTASTHNYIYSPLSWLLYIFPEKYFSFAMTVRMFIETWLVGVFGYLLFREELKDKKCSLFASIVLQLCGFRFFSITTYEALTLHLFTLISLYLIWNLGKRRSHLTYLYLTFSLAILMLNGNIAYSFGSLLCVGVLVLYKHRMLSGPHFRLSREGILILLSLVTSAAIAMIRLLPVMLALPEGDRIGTGSLQSAVGNFTNHFYLSFIAFVPELLGTTFDSSVAMISKVNPVMAGQNMQIFGYSYFGALAALLVVWEYLNWRESKIRFWLLYLLITSAWFLTIPPISDVFDLILYPFKHVIIPKMMIPIGFCMIAGHAAKEIASSGYGMSDRRVKNFILAAAVVIASFLIVCAYEHDTFVRWSRFALIAAALLGVFGYGWFTRYQAVPAAACALLLIGIGVQILRLMPVSQHALFFMTSLCLLASILALGLLWFSIMVYNSDKAGLKSYVPCFLAISILLIVLVMVYPFDGLARNLSGQETAILTQLGILRFFLVLFLFLSLLMAIKNRKIRNTSLFMIFIMITVFDLLPYNQAYSHMLSSPFYQASTLYPPKDDLLRERSKFRQLLTESKSKKKNHVEHSAFSEWDPSVNSLPPSWSLFGARELGIVKLNGGKVNPSFVRIMNRAGGTVFAGLYQKIKDGARLAGRRVTFGAWVRTSSPGQYRLSIAEEEGASSYSNYHTGSGEWEWLQVNHWVTPFASGLKVAVLSLAPGDVDVDGITLIETQSNLESLKSRSGASAEQGPSGEVESLDSQNYRVNYPHRLLSISAVELQTNIPALYGIRSYGGVNSQIKRRHLQLMDQFSPAIRLGGGVAANLENERYLDLLGCRYDVNELSDVRIRPGALSRFMLFQDFVVAQNDEDALKMVVDPDLDIQTKLILQSDPKIPRQNTGRQAIPLKYESISLSRLELSVKSDAPGLVFFGDSYHEGWKVYVNGKRRALRQADYNFMAVTVPSGESKVTFLFRPAPFYYGSVLSLIGLGLMLMVAVIFYRIEERRV